MAGHRFPGYAEDLPRGVYWYRREKTHGGGNQAQGYDIVAARFDEQRQDWTNRRPGTDGSQNAHHLAYGLPVRAVADGVVTRGWRNAPENPRPGDSHPGRLSDPPTISGGGNHVWTELADGSRVLYAHLQPGTVPRLVPMENEFISNPDDTQIPPDAQITVKAGTFLGLDGNSGASSGPHLHIPREKDGKPLPFAFDGFWFKSRELGQDRSSDWQRATDAPVPSGPVLLLPDYGPGAGVLARHAVAEVDYQFVVEHVTGSGYRPVWIDAYDVNGATFFNVIFRPQDGISWIARHGLTAQAYQQEFDHRSGDGWRPVHVESYRHRGDQLRYAVIFRRQNGADWSAYHGLNQDQHQERFADLRDQGFRPVNVSVVSIGGRLHYTALYERSDVGSFRLASTLTADQYQHEFKANRGAGRGLAYLNAYQHEGSPRFSAIWTAAAANGGFVARHGMSSSVYQQEFDEQAQSPRALRLVTGYEQQNGHRFAALWRQ